MSKILEDFGDLTDYASSKTVNNVDLDKNQKLLDEKKKLEKQKKAKVFQLAGASLGTAVGFKLLADKFKT